MSHPAAVPTFRMPPAFVLAQVKAWANAATPRAVENVLALDAAAFQDWAEAVAHLEWVQLFPASQEQWWGHLRRALERAPDADPVGYVLTGDAPIAARLKAHWAMQRADSQVVHGGVLLDGPAGE